MSAPPNTQLAILVIDDDAVIRLMYELLLTRWGYAVHCAASTSEVEMALDGGFIPDAILSDYNLGRGDTGVAAIGLLVERLGHEVPALMISGEDRVPVVGIPVLRKPVTPKQLEIAVAQMLRRPVKAAG